MTERENIQSERNKNPIEKRASHIHDLLTQYENDIEGCWEEVNRCLVSRETQLVQTEPFNTEELEDVFVSALFLSNWKKFQENEREIGVPVEETTYDYEKEGLQIESVVALLEGKHLDLNTGQGKTRVILPITAIVEAFTSTQRNIMVTTINDKLLQELHESIQSYYHLLPEHIRARLDIVPISKEKEVQDKEKERLERDIHIESLLLGELSDNTKKKVRDAYWGRMLYPNIHQTVSDDDRLSAALSLEIPSDKHRIIVCRSEAFAFGYLHNPELFKGRCPGVLMDEGHYEADSRAQYRTTTLDEFPTPEEMQDSTVEWLLHYVVAREMEARIQTGDLLYSQGRTVLSDDFLESLFDRKTGIIFDSSNAFFREGVQVIAEGLGISSQNEAVINILVEKMQEYVTNSIGKEYISEYEAENEKRKQLRRQFEKGQVPDIPEEDMEELEFLTLEHAIADIANRLSSMWGEEGSSFITDAQGIVVRNEYLGRLTPDQTYEPEYHIAALAKQRKFDYVPLTSITHSTMTYHTLLANMADSIQCVSGTLYFSDPLNQQLRPTAFAQFLEETTGRDTYVIKTLDTKQLPVPAFLGTNNEQNLSSHEHTINQLVADRLRSLQEKKSPQLILCWHESEAEQIKERLLESISQRQDINDLSIAVVSSTTKPDVEEELYAKLAKGEIDILISSGQAGVGVDIKDPGKSGADAFPDIHISLFGLPKSTQQVSQAIGRRRRAGNNFSWYVSHEAIAKTASYLEDLQARIQGKRIDVKKLDSLLQKGDMSAEQRLELVVSLLNVVEISEREDVEVNLRYDQAYETGFKPWSLDILRDLIRKDGIVDEEEIEELVAEYGLPASLYGLIRQQMHFAGKSTSWRNLITYDLPLFLQDKQFTPSLLESWIQDWYETRKTLTLQIEDIVTESGAILAGVKVQHKATQLPNNPKIKPGSEVINYEPRVRELGGGIFVEYDYEVNNGEKGRVVVHGTDNMAVVQPTGNYEMAMLDTGIRNHQRRCVLYVKKPQN